MEILPYLLILLGTYLVYVGLMALRKKPAPGPPAAISPAEPPAGALPPRYLRFASLALAVAALLFVALPFVLRLFVPTAGGFDVGTINTLALAGLQYFAAAHLALFTYKRLLPSFYAYLGEFLQDKVLENLTAPLEEILLHPETLDAGLLPALTERRKLLQFKFAIRCARLLICLLPLLFFFVLAQAALTAALTIVPH